MNTKGKVNWPYAILTVLLAADVFLIFVHILIVQFWNQKPSFFLLDARGFGIPESFQYLKYLGIIGLIIYLAYLKKSFFYIVLIMFFLSLLIVDIFQLHHLASLWLSRVFVSFNLFEVEPLSAGHIIYSVIVLCFFLLLTLLYYVFVSKVSHIFFSHIFVLFWSFLFFGVVVDLLHGLFEKGQQIRMILTIVEEGGEMLSLSLLFWGFFRLIQQSIAAEPNLKNDYLPH
ncbi:hypothetical protein [Algibacter mikhailovii]|uniref:hypothetical protein n=1 Tax=Algibacter mikhailovii TaxID=425498 RepID=UPI0024941218|nr:hypothetical protein [Algibacter mikhailovii]